MQYSFCGAGMDEGPAACASTMDRLDGYPAGPEREPDYQSGYHPGPGKPANGLSQSSQIPAALSAGCSPPRRPRRRRFSPLAARLRAVGIDEYCRRHYMPDRAVSQATRGLISDLLGHVARAKGEVLVAGLTQTLLYELREYFAILLADGDLRPATANKHLRQLRAIANHAAEERLVKTVRFRRFFPEEEPRVEIWEPDELARIEAQARAAVGQVGRVAAAVWWTAWWLTISRIGCRLSALMLAARGDYQHGVLWLRAEHQKQHEDQKFRLPARSIAALEDLLAAHDEPYLFPWPHDPGSYGAGDGDKKTNWKTFFSHFERRLLTPCGISLPKGVKTRMCRRSAATLATENGGSGQRLCGHKSASTTKRHYTPRGRGVPILTDALCIPDGGAARQLDLFGKDRVP